MTKAGVNKGCERNLCKKKKPFVYEVVLFNNTNCYFYFFVFTMFKNIAYLQLLAALFQGIISAFQPITENNHVLVGHVFQQLYSRDWFSCIQACQDEPRCISYNYERSAPRANGLCELNDCGVEDLCDRDKSLIYSVGFVFQQIRESKVSFWSLTDNASVLSIPTLLSMAGCQ